MNIIICWISCNVLWCESMKVSPAIDAQKGCLAEFLSHLTLPFVSLFAQNMFDCGKNNHFKTLKNMSGVGRVTEYKNFVGVSIFKQTTGVM